MKSLMEKYNLSPHPEGGYFKEVFRSELKVNSPHAQTPRNAATHIYFLLMRGQVSRFHRVVHDEIWHFYQGDALKLILYDGKRVREEIIGPGAHVLVVQAGTWQAADPLGEYSLVGCTVAPGFDFKDFSFLADTPDSVSEFGRAHEKYKKYL